MTGVPKVSLRFFATARARMSPRLPGGYGLTIVMGFPGMGKSATVATPASAVCQQAGLEELSHVRPPLFVSRPGLRGHRRRSARKPTRPLPAPMAIVRIGPRVVRLTATHALKIARMALLSWSSRCHARDRRRRPAHQPTCLARACRPDRGRRQSRVLGRAGDCLQRCHADLLDEDLQLTCMPLAEGRDRKTGVGSRHERPCAVRVTQHVQRGFVVSPHAIDAQRRAANEVPVVSDVGEEGQRWAERMPLAASRSHWARVM